MIVTITVNAITVIESKPMIQLLGECRRHHDQQQHLAPHLRQGGAQRQLHGGVVRIRITGGLEHLPRAIMLTQAEDVARRLRHKARLARGVTVKIRFGDFQTITRSTTFDRPTDLTDELYRVEGQEFRSVGGIQTAYYGHPRTYTVGFDYSF